MHCGACLMIGDDNKGTLVFSENKAVKTNFVRQEPAEQQMQYVARRLAPIYCDEVSLDSQLTKSITLFDMYGIFTTNDLDIFWISDRCF